MEQRRLDCRDRQLVRRTACHRTGGADVEQASADAAVRRENRASRGVHECATGDVMAADPEVVAALGKSALFVGLPTDVLEALAEQSRLRRFGRGQVVYVAGDPSDGLLVVKSGRLKVVTRSADGGELMLAVARAGDSLGELSVIDDGARSADVEVLDACEV